VLTDSTPSSFNVRVSSLFVAHNATSTTSASASSSLYSNSAFSFKSRGEDKVVSTPTHYSNPAFSFKGRGGNSDVSVHFNNPAFNMGKKRTQSFLTPGQLPPATSNVPISDGAAPEEAHAILMEQARITRASNAERGAVEESAPVYVPLVVNPNEYKLRTLRKSLRELLNKVSASCATPGAESACTSILSDLGCTLVFPDADRQRVIADEVKRKISELETASVEDLDQFGATLQRLSVVDLSGRTPTSMPASATEITPDVTNALTLSSVPIFADIRNHYKTLEISPDANVKDIKAAYRRLSPLYHPDTAVEYDEKQWHDLLDAYTTLSDPTSRAAYDLGGDAAVNDASASPSAAESSANYLAKVRDLRQRIKDLSADLRCAKKTVKHAKAAQVDSASALETALAARDTALEVYSNSVRAKDFKVKQNAIKGMKQSWAFFLTSTTPPLRALAEAQALFNARDVEDTACMDQIRASEQAALVCTQALAALEKELTSTVDTWSRPTTTSAPRRLALGVSSSQQAIKDAQEEEDARVAEMRRGKRNKRGGAGASGGDGDDY
jgi:curved DNA-binding protein CbpA